MRKGQPESLGSTILFTPTTILEGSYEQDLAAFVGQGGKVLFYGPLANSPGVIKDLLNIRLAEPLCGELALHTNLPRDEFENSPTQANLHHGPIVSAGSVEEVLASENENHTEVWAVVRQAANERVYAVTRSLESWNGGTVGWIRGSNPFSTDRDPDAPSRVPTPLPKTSFDPSVLVRHLLSRFGITLLQRRRSQESLVIMTFVARHRNGFFFSGYKQDTTAVWRCRFPDGAPLLLGREARLENGLATYFLDRSFHEECRVFASQEAQGVVSSTEEPRLPWGKEPKLTGKRRILRLSGLQSTDLVIYPPLERLDKLTAYCDGKELHVRRSASKPCADVAGASGTIYIAW